MKRILLSLCSLLALASSGTSGKQLPQDSVDPTAKVTKMSDTPDVAHRGQEQTLLTFPEWFLVHSPAEYAAVTATKPSHSFPFITHIAQLWASYAAVTREQFRRKLPRNGAYHTMIMVISTSTTVEYAIRGVYENTVGRLAYYLSLCTRTEEDVYGAKLAQDYVDFIRKEPWYLFDFKTALTGLWGSVPLFGDGMVRKIERRYALTTEYSIKWAYAAVINKATRAAYEPALLVTQVTLHRDTGITVEGLAAEGLGMVQVLKVAGPNTVIADVPRYYAFRTTAQTLALKGYKLEEVAGNTGDIMVTFFADTPERMGVLPENILFEQSVISRKNTNRFALLLPVGRLSQFLLDAHAKGVTVEHVYDY
jgi:hypothetical protein